MGDIGILICTVLMYYYCHWDEFFTDWNKFANTGGGKVCGVKTVGGQTRFRSESRQYIPNGTKKSPAFRKDICLKSSCKSVSLVTASFCHIERLRQYKQIQEHVWRQIYCQNRRRYWEVVNGDRKRRLPCTSWYRKNSDRNTTQKRQKIPMPSKSHQRWQKEDERPQ